MKVRKLRELDEIVQETGSFELVLVPDGGLASALNCQLEESGAKKFQTPEEAAGFDNGWSQELFLRLKEGRSWREASYLKDAAESCLRKTGSLESLNSLDIEQEKIERTREIAEQLVLKSEIGEKKVAVIGEEAMDGLQRSILPEEYQKIELFEDDTELDEFRIFQTPGDIAATVEKNIRSIGPESCAVVVSENSVYRSAVTSRLEAAEIPYYSRESRSKDQNLRTFVALLRAGTSSGSLSVESVKPVLDQLGIYYPDSKTSARISSVDSLEGFRELLSILPNLDFGDALDRFEELAGETEIGQILDQLDLRDKPVSTETLSSLTYYLESVQTGSVNEEGVRIVEPSKAGYIDRSVVFFLGMDDEWNPEVEDWPWIEEESEIELSINRMELPLQSGERQIYMVQDREMNRNVQPCIQVQEITDESLESFRDAPHTDHSVVQEEVEDQSFERKSIEYEKEYEINTESMSQSRLNDLALSPKQYYFSRLVSDADDLSMEKGNLFHDFAEFYVSYPDFVDQEGIERFVEVILDELEQYSEEIQMRSLETEIRTALKNLESFLEPQGALEIEIDREEDSHSENFFAKKYERPVRSENTEIAFNDRSVGVKGKIDLIQDQNEIVDFKSGRSKSGFKSFRKTHPDLYSEERFPDFQPLLYICFLRQYIDGRMKFTFFYFLDSLGDSVLDERNEEDDLVELIYIPKSFEKYAQTNEFFQKVIGDVAESNDRRKTLEKIGRAHFANFMDRKGFPQIYSKGEITETEFFQLLLKFGRETVGDYKYVSNGLESAAKKMVEIRTSNFFMEDVDRFEEFLEEKRGELEEYLEEGFPVGERKIDELPDRDLIVE